MSDVVTVDLVFVWFEHALAEPIAEYWQVLLVPCLALGILLQCWSAVLALQDRFYLWRLRRLRQEDDAPCSEHGLRNRGVRGVVAEIFLRGNGGRKVVEPAHIRVLTSGRYGWCLEFADSLRSASTLIGLLFTFVGLGLGLYELQGTINTALSDSDADVIEKVLSQVGDVLPGLSLAFVSSIAGVFNAVVLGLMGAAIEVWTLSTEDALCRFSVFEQSSLKEDGEGQDLHVVLANLARDSRDMQEVLNDLKTALDARGEADVREQTRDEKLLAALSGLETSMTALPRMLTASLGQSLQRLSAAAQRSAEVLEASGRSAGEAIRTGGEHAGTSLQDGATDAAATLRSGGRETSGLVGEGIAAAAALLVAGIHESRSGWDDLMQTVEATTTGVSDLSGQLVTTTTAFRRELERVSRTFQVSAAQISALQQTSERFITAIDYMQELVEESDHHQRSVSSNVEMTFAHVRPMAEQMLKLSTAATTAANNLGEVFGGEAMRYFLSELPRLTALVEEERKTRTSLLEATRSLGEIGNTVAAVNHQVQELGGLVGEFSAVYDELRGATSALAKGQLTPAMEAVVRVAVQGASSETLAAFESGWLPVIERQNDQIERALVALGESTQNMTAVTARLMEHPQAVPALIEEETLWRRIRSTLKKRLW